MVRCSNCGGELADTAAYCGHCGADAPARDLVAVPVAAAEGVGRPERDEVLPHEVRRWWFSALLIMGMLGDAYLVYKCLFRETALRREIAAYGMFQTLPGWYFPFTGFAALAHLLFLIAVWDFYKWGVCGLALLSVVNLGATFYLHFSLRLALVSLVVHWGVLLLLLWPTWKHFRWRPR